MWKKIILAMNEEKFESNVCKFFRLNWKGWVGVGYVGCRVICSSVVIWFVNLFC